MLPMVADPPSVLKTQGWTQAWRTSAPTAWDSTPFPLFARGLGGFPLTPNTNWGHRWVESIFTTSRHRDARGLPKLASAAGHEGPQLGDAVPPQSQHGATTGTW